MRKYEGKNDQILEKLREKKINKKIQKLRF